MFLFSGAFWGLLLIVLGVSLVVKYVFNIDFPVFRVIFAVFLVFVGIKLLVGGFGHQSHTSMFAESRFDFVENHKDYSCAFGKTTLDLRNSEITEDTDIKASCAFGEFIIKINPETNIEIISSSAFGNLSLPDHSSHSFGNGNYKTPGFNKSKPVLRIKADVAFGNMEIRY